MSRTKRLLLDAVTLGCAVAAVAWAFSQWDGALRVVLILATVVAYLSYLTPRLGVDVLDRLIHLARAFHWRHEQGRHHAFNGVSLRIEDDGRHVWIDGFGLQRVLGSKDAEDVFAARHAGRWRRDRDGDLMLRVDAVVEVLATGPGRLDPRTVRLRRYLEREVLFPAAERHRRKRT